MPGVFFPQCRVALSVIFDGFGRQDDDSRATWFHIIPRSCSVHLTGYKEADTFSLEFDAAALPFSPELIRSCAVEIYLFGTQGLGNVPAVDASSSALRIGFGDDSFFTDFLASQRVTPAPTLIGLVDNANFEYSESGRTFRMDGRDYTAILLDKQWPSGERVPLGDPLNVTVQKLVNKGLSRNIYDPIKGTHQVATPVNTLVVEYVGTDGIVTSGVPATVTQKTVKIPKAGAHGSKTKKRGLPVKSGKSYWDVIYELCLHHGHICYVKGNKVIISTPKVLSDRARERIRAMAYGQNLSQLSVERHLGRETVPQIVVTGYDTKTRKRLVAKFPEKYKGKQTGIETYKEEQRIYTLGGVDSEGELKKFARLAYENLAISEAKVRFKTRDLKDLQQKDLLTLRPGDPVELKFNAFNDEDMRQLSEAGREKRLIEVGYSPEVAALVAREYTRIKQFSRAFYTKSVDIDWSLEDGIVIGAELVNFIAEQRDGLNENSLNMVGGTDVATT